MFFYLNESSLHGQFESLDDFLESLRTVIKCLEIIHKIPDVKIYKIKNFYSCQITKEEKIKDLRGYELPAFFDDDSERLVQKGEIMVIQGNLRRGFEYPALKFVMISESDIFGAEKKKRKKVKQYSGQKISSFNDLTFGDYVVHENHGVGIYRGIEKIEVDKVVPGRHRILIHALIIDIALNQAAVHQGLQDYVDHVLGAAGDHDLVGSILQTPVLLQAVADGIAHIHGACSRGVTGQGIFNGADAGGSGRMPASLTFSGVLKSGSPMPKPITSMPSAFMRLNFISISMVVEAWTALATLDNAFIRQASLYSFLSRRSFS